jgi:hypothetical protein
VYVLGVSDGLGVAVDVVEGSMQPPSTNMSPGSHAVQAPLLRSHRLQCAPPGPIEHSAQPVMPTRAANLPAGHARHMAEPDAELAVPKGHGVQGSLPPPLYLPAPHIVCDAATSACQPRTATTRGCSG